MKNLKIISTIFVLFILISCSKFPDLGNGYQLDYNSMGDIHLVKILNEADAPTSLVHGHIIEYTFDSTFIIIVERPRDIVPGFGIMKKDEYDITFEQSTFKQYWIINKKEKTEFNELTKTYSNVYGPFTTQKYLYMRNKMNIPKIYYLIKNLIN